MVMLSERRIAEVVGERVVLLWERGPGYRNGLTAALVEIVSAQDEGFSDRHRRERVKRIIERLGAQLPVQQGDS